MRTVACLVICGALAWAGACQPVEAPSRDGGGDAAPHAADASIDGTSAFDGAPDADTTCEHCADQATCIYSEEDGWACVCNDGFAGDGFTCEDIDECTTDNGGCLANAVCENLPGTRLCHCQEGWVGDGETSCRTGLIFFANGSSDTDRFFKSYDVNTGAVTDETLMTLAHNDFCGCGYYCWSPMVAGGALYYFANEGQRYTSIWQSVGYPDARRRGEYGTAVIDGKIYMVGSRDIVFTVQYYDTSTHLWSPVGGVADYPWKVEWPAVAAIEGKLYVVGGAVDGVASDKMAVYDPGTNAWTTLAPAPFTSQRPYGAAAGGKMYVFYNNAIHVYNPASGWENTAIAPPSGGSDWKPAVVNDQLYVVGDVNADVRIYRLSGSNWSLETTVPGVNMGYWSHVAGTR